MVFLFVLFFCLLHFYGIKKTRNGFLFFVPPFLMCFIFSALQFNVGSDYFSYKFIYDNPWVLGRYFNDGEYFFFYVNEILHYLDMNYQFIFVVFSFVQTLFIFVFFKRVRNYGFNLCLIFFIFFVVTNIYHNQMNGIRQYAAVCLFPFMALILYERKMVFYLLLCLFSLTLHSSSVVFFLFVLSPFLITKSNKFFIIFVVTLPFYIIFPKIILILLNFLDVRYVSYIDSVYFEPKGFLSLVTKLYYLPIILYFYYIYDKSKEYIIISDSKRHLMDFFVFIFSLTYWSIVMMLDAAIFSRLSSYFWFFIIFPMYYSIYYSYLKKPIFSFFIIFYLFVPYLLKVTVFAKNEYVYHSFIFN